MRGSTLGTAVLVLGGLLAATYLLGAVLGGAFIDWEEERGDRAFWIAFLLIGALLLVAGLVTGARSRWLAAALLSFGAAVGAVVTFWSIIVPVAAIALIVLSVLWARRPATALERTGP